MSDEQANPSPESPNEAPPSEAAPTPVEAPPAAAVDPSVLAELAGRYTRVTRRFGPLPEGHALEIRADDGALTVTGEEGRERRLLPVEPPFFRRPEDTLPTAAFVRDHRGRLYLQGPFGNFERTTPR